MEMNLFLSISLQMGHHLRDKVRDH